MRKLMAIGAMGVMFLAGVAAAAAEEWPAWRGPRGDAISREKVPDAWPAGGPQRLWSAEVGQGYSSPVAVDGRLYAFSMADDKEVLTCLDAAKGSVIWKQEYAGGFTADYPGTRASPLIEGKFIYTHGGAGELTCRELADGKEVWRINVLKKLGEGLLKWGQASNPTIIGDSLIVQGGKGGPFAIAVNKGTGQELWRTADALGGYAQPLPIEVAGTTQLVIFGGDAVHGVNPADGKTIWSEPWKTKYDVNAATPIYRDGKLFITSNYKRGCMMMEVTAEGAKKLWEKKDIGCRFQPPILDGNVLYANDEGSLKCMSWPDGEIRWNQRGVLSIGNGGSMVRSGDKLVIFTDQGKLILAQATPDVFKIISEKQIFDGNELWSAPLLYDGKLYLKGKDGKGKHELVCFDAGAQ